MTTTDRLFLSNDLHLPQNLPYYLVHLVLDKVVVKPTQYKLCINFKMCFFTLEQSMVILNIFHICSCAPSESSYSTCNAMALSLNDTRTLPTIPANELLGKYTLIKNGLEIWHCMLMLVATISIVNLLTYITLRFIRKPKLA